MTVHRKTRWAIHDRARDLARRVGEIDEATRAAIMFIAVFCIVFSVVGVLTG